jgi:hypothetical protein
LHAQEVSWKGNPLTLELPRQGARQGQEQQQAGGGGAVTCAEPASLYILNVGSALSPEQLRKYFKERYASVVSAKIASSGIGVVHFTSVEERQRAREEMDGHVLPGALPIQCVYVRVVLFVLCALVCACACAWHGLRSWATSGGS